MQLFIRRSQELKFPTGIMCYFGESWLFDKTYLQKSAFGSKELQVVKLIAEFQSWMLKPRTCYGCSE